jgi:signal transduction histidine kinase
MKPDRPPEIHLLSSHTDHGGGSCSFAAELVLAGSWGEEEESLLAEIATRLSSHIDEIAQLWAERLVPHVPVPLDQRAQLQPAIAALNRWFLEDHFGHLRERNLDTALQKNFDNDLALLRSQRGGQAELRSTLFQLYLSLEISTQLIAEWVKKLYATDPRLPALLDVYGRFALHLAKIVGQAFYQARAEELHEALRVEASLLETSRELSARAASVVGVLTHLSHIVGRLLRCDKSLTFLWHDSEHAYVAAAHGLGFSESEMAEIKQYRFRPGEHAVTDLLLGGEAVSGVLDDGRVARELMERHDLAAYALAPITDAAARPLGVLAGYRRTRKPFGSTDLRILRGVAQNAGLAIQNARLVEQLEAAARLKGEFINSMSHEIRTPLNILFGYLDMLRDHWRGDGHASEILARMRQNAGYVLRLVNTILDIGRIESGRMPVHLERFRAQTLLADLHEMFDSMARQQGIQFICHVEGQVPVLTTDRLKLAEILSNLVANAFKFTERGTVAVRARAGHEGSRIVFEVSDTGIGIEPEAVDAIFDLFRQVGRTDRGGTGLGLYIVKRLTDLLGGEVNLISRPGQGSTFRVSIPAAMPGAKLTLADRDE